MILRHGEVHLPDPAGKWWNLKTKGNGFEACLEHPQAVAKIIWERSRQIQSDPNEARDARLLPKRGYAFVRQRRSDCCDVVVVVVVAVVL